jgi:hypothetical protein
MRFPNMPSAAGSAKRNQGERNLTFNDFKSSFLESVTEFSIIDMVLAMLFALYRGPVYISHL